MHSIDLFRASAVDLQRRFQYKPVGRPPCGTMEMVLVHGRPQSPEHGEVRGEFHCPYLSSRKAPFTESDPPQESHFFLQVFRRCGAVKALVAALARLAPSSLPDGAATDLVAFRCFGDTPGNHRGLEFGVKTSLLKQGNQGNCPYETGDHGWKTRTWSCEHGLRMNMVRWSTSMMSRSYSAWNSHGYVNGTTCW